MKKIIFLLIVITTLLMVAFVVPTAAANQVKVSIAPCNVILNGHYIDNQYAEYPMIMYKDITYIPMTYGYARFMGLSTDFDNVNRTFRISQIPEYTDNPDIIKTLSPNNENYYIAVIPDYSIVINNNKVISNNYKKKYPVLNFRDVTYFPLTWEYIVEDFGWYYTFSQNAGLNIKRSADKNYDSLNYTAGVELFFDGRSLFNGARNNAVLYDGEVLVPFNTETLAGLGFIEDWMSVWNDEKSVSFSGGDASCTFFEDEKVALKSWSDGNSISYKTDAPTIKINGVFFVPLKTLCDMWDFQMQYSSYNNTVNVTYGRAAQYLTEEQAREKLNNVLGDLGTWVEGEKNVLTGWGVYNCFGKNYYQFRLSGRVGNHYTALTWYVVAVDGTEVFEGQCMNGYLDSWRPLM